MNIRPRMTLHIILIKEGIFEKNIITMLETLLFINI